MIRLFNYLKAGLFLFTFSGLAAQNSQVIYHMDLPQNHLLNPAFRQTSLVYVGLPALTGINLNLANNFFNFEDLFSEGEQVSESTMSFLDPGFDANKFLSKINDRNHLETQVAIQMFGLGFTAGKGNYFFIDIIDRVESNIVFPRDLIRLGFLGNKEFAGETFDLSSLRTDLKYFRETGIGFSKDITERLRIGVKGKLLTGLAAMSLDNNKIDLTVNSDYTNTLVTDMAINISGPIQVIKNSENKIDEIDFDDERFESSAGVTEFLTSTKNIGFGADIGAEFDLTDNIVLSAAITDLGFIKWKSDVTSLKAESDITLGGLDIGDVHEGSATFEEVVTGMLDSVINSLTVYESAQSFRTKLPLGISAGGKYILDDRISFGVLSHTRIIGEQIREAVTLSANLNIRNFFSATLAYTAGNKRYANLGAGLSIRGAWFQFYLVADKIPVMWKTIMTGDGKVPLPSNWNTLNTRVGINLLFGNRRKSDQPII